MRDILSIPGPELMCDVCVVLRDGGLGGYREWEMDPDEMVLSVLGSKKGKSQRG